MTSIVNYLTNSPKIKQSLRKHRAIQYCCYYAAFCIIMQLRKDLGHECQRKAFGNSRNAFAKLKRSTDSHLRDTLIQPNSDIAI